MQQRATVDIDLHNRPQLGRRDDRQYASWSWSVTFAGWSGIVLCARFGHDRAAIDDQLRLKGRATGRL